VQDLTMEENKVRKEKKANIIGNYKLGKVLGTGSFGSVRLGVNIITGEEFAIKPLCNHPHSKTILQKEVPLLKLLDHPNIIQLHEVIVHPKTGTHYMVLELARGGELLDYVVARGRLKEKEARKFFRQIISGVEYCHSNLVIHGNMKPDYFLLDLDGNVKINGFGFSNVIMSGERFSRFCGSVSYVAPKIIRNISYIGPEVDVWSLGVVLYVLVCGCLPWPETPDGSPAITNIIEGDYQKPPLLVVSAACQDLISKILTPNPAERCTIQDIRGHAWVNEGYSEPPPSLVQQSSPIIKSA